MPPEVSGAGKPAEIADGAAQRVFGNPGSILERLQLRLPNRSARSLFVRTSLSSVY
jgi:hypothetical protein